MDTACREIPMGARVTEKFEDPHFPRVRGFPGFWIPGPSCLVGPGSLQGPVPRPLCSRTLRVIPHTTQHWVLASFAVDPGVRNRRNSAPDPDSAPPSPRPLAAPGGSSPGNTSPSDPKTLYVAPRLGRRSRLPPGAVLPSRPPLATGRQWRRLLPKRRRRGRVSHAAGAREPAPPPPSRAAA